MLWIEDSEPKIKCSSCGKENTSLYANGWKKLIEKEAIPFETGVLKIPSKNVKYSDSYWFFCEDCYKEKFAFLTKYTDKTSIIKETIETEFC